MEIYTVSQDHLWVQRRWHLKERERNLLAAMLSIVVVAVLATAMAQPRWFNLKGGGCSQTYIGVQQFFPLGRFEAQTMATIDSNSITPTSLIYYLSGNSALRDCVTPKIVGLLKINIAFCLVAISFSLIQFGCDTLGPISRRAKLFRRNAFGSIATVVLCVGSIGMCYYTSTLMEEQQEGSKRNMGTKINVKFDISFYLVTAAGAVAILAAAANLLRHYPLNDDEDQIEDHLLDDYDGSETFSVGNTHCQLWPCGSQSRSDYPSVANPAIRQTRISFSGIAPGSSLVAPPPPYSP